MIISVEEVYFLLPLLCTLFAFGYLAGAGKCGIDIFAEILLADLVIYTGLMEELHGLVVNMAHNEGDALLLAGLD